MNWQGKLAVVTGASSGIGAATARLIAEKGGRVVLLARTEEKLQQVSAGISQTGGRSSFYPVDLTNPHATAYIAQQILIDQGVPDLLINNAGAGRWLTVMETDPEEAMQMMAAPYFAAFNTTHAFVPAMLNQNRGHILNVTSLACYIGFPGATGYIAARWAMRGFTEGLRGDLHRTPIGVTLFAAGKVDTPYFAHNPGSEARLPGLSRLMPTLTETQTAAALVKGVEQRKREVVVPAMGAVLLFFNRFFPRLVESLLYRTGWQGK